MLRGFLGKYFYNEEHSYTSIYQVITDYGFEHPFMFRLARAFRDVMSAPWSPGSLANMVSDAADADFDSDDEALAYLVFLYKSLLLHLRDDDQEVP